MAEALVPNHALSSAVRKIGSQSAMARLLGLTQGAISKWIASGKQLPAEHVLKVEESTGISRHDLRPDIYGPAPALLDGPAEYERAR